MKNAILNAPYLQSVRSNQCAIIDGVNYMCSTGNSNFNVVAYGSPLNISWSVVTNNLTIIGSNTGSNTGSSVTVTSTDPNYNGVATISVNINGVIKTKTITIGVPVNNNQQVVGLYDWVSTGYGFMGLIAPTNPSITSFSWEIVEDPDFINTCSQSIKPKFIGSPTNDPYHYTSTSNQAVVNWGSCVASYLISCHAINDCGEMIYDQRYTDVGNPKNNPCYKNTVHTVIAPNPVHNRQINIRLDKTIQSQPCNWRDIYEPQFFNRKLDQINNSVSIYDFDGNLIFNKVYETDEFTIEDAPIRNGYNYVVNVFTNEGGFTQQVIIVE